MKEFITIFIATRPEYADAKQCRRKLVGPMRRFLQGNAKEVLTLPELPPRLRPVYEERAELQIMLSRLCAICGRCEEEKILR